MAKAFYMAFNKHKNNHFDKTGGIPTHQPKVWPTSSVTGNRLGFLAQFYSESTRLPLNDILCIQIYQSLDIDHGDDFMPIPVSVPLGADLNEDDGSLNDLVDELYISYLPPEQEPLFINEPETLQDSTFQKQIQSKLGGSFFPESSAAFGMSNGTLIEAK